MDNALRGFLERQYTEAMALAEKSDLLDLRPLEGEPPYKYVAHFSCKGLVKNGSEITEAESFLVGIMMPSDYLARVEPLEVVSWLAPRNIHHPNVGRGPIRREGPLLICVGDISPATTLVDILYQVFEIITYNNMTMQESNALNWEACAWARQNLQRFPVDSRPLKRRTLNVELEDLKA